MKTKDYNDSFSFFFKRISWNFELSIIFQILLHHGFLFFFYHNGRENETLGEIEIREKLFDFSNCSNFSIYIYIFSFIKFNLEEELNLYEACNFIRDIIFNFSFQDLSIGGRYLKAGGCLSESESRVSFRFQFHETRSVSYFRFQNIQADVILSPLILFRSIIFLFLIVLSIEYSHFPRPGDFKNFEKRL